MTESLRKEIYYEFVARGAEQVARQNRRIKDSFSAASKTFGNASLKMQRGLKDLGTHSVLTQRSMEELNDTYRRSAISTRIGANGLHEYSNNISVVNTQNDLLVVSSKQAGNAISSTSRQVKVAGNQMVRTSYQTAMVAAQFQDIGITAAMGMSPVMIALQQGTQLGGQFMLTGEGLLGTLKSIGSGFLRLLGPVSLFALAMTGGLAYMIQSVNWSKVLANILYTLSYAFSVVADNILYFSPALTALAVTKLPALALSIKRITMAIYVGLVPALKSLSTILMTVYTPFRAILVGLTAISFVLGKFTNVLDKVNVKIRDMFGVDIKETLKTVFVTLPSLGAKKLSEWGDIMSATADEAEEDAKKILTVWEGITEGFAEWNKKASDVGGAIKTYITGNLTKASDTFSSLITNFVLGTDKSLKSALDAVAKFGRALIAELIAIGSRMLASYAIRTLIGFLGGGTFGGLISSVQGLMSNAKGFISNTTQKLGVNPSSSLINPRPKTEATMVNIYNNGSPLNIESSVQKYDNTDNKVVDIVVSNLQQTDSALFRTSELKRRY